MWSPFVADSMKHVKLDFSVPPLASDDEFEGFDVPVQVVGSDLDAFFPGPAVLDRARQLFGDGVRTRLTPNCRHIPPFSTEFTTPWLAEVTAFLEQDVRPRRAGAREVAARPE
jgi:hypothetical protein